MVRVPRVLVVTDRRIAFFPLPYQVSRTLAGIEKLGPSAVSKVGVLYREKDLEPSRRFELANCVAEVTFSYGASFIVATSSQRDGGALIAKELTATGLHLSSDALYPSKHALYGGLLGRSTHSPWAYFRAFIEGADYVTISPIFSSLSKKGFTGSGVDLIRAVRSSAVEGTRRPVLLALGGIEIGKAKECITAGADGVAVCGAVMKSRDPSSIAVSLLREVEAVSEKGKNR